MRALRIVVYSCGGGGPLVLTSNQALRCWTRRQVRVLRMDRVAAAHHHERMVRSLVRLWGSSGPSTCAVHHHGSHSLNIEALLQHHREKRILHPSINVQRVQTTSPSLYLFCSYLLLQPKKPPTPAPGRDDPQYTANEPIDHCN